MFNIFDFYINAFYKDIKLVLKIFLKSNIIYLQGVKTKNDY